MASGITDLHSANAWDKGSSLVAVGRAKVRMLRLVGMHAIESKATSGLAA